MFEGDGEVRLQPDFVWLGISDLETVVLFEFTPSVFILKFLILDYHVCVFAHRQSEQASE